MRISETMFDAFLSITGLALITFGHSSLKFSGMFLFGVGIGRLQK